MSDDNNGWELIAGGEGVNLPDEAQALLRITILVWTLDSGGAEIRIESTTDDSVEVDRAFAVAMADLTVARSSLQD